MSLRFAIIRSCYVRMARPVTSLTLCRLPEIKPPYAMTKILSAIVCCLCLLIGGGFSAARAIAAELDKIIAVVEDDVIMQSELDQLVGKARSEIRKRGSEPPRN